MSPERLLAPRRQSGASIVFAIFIMVVLGGLAAVLARMVATSNIGAGQDASSARVRQAALGGMEVGLYQWIVNNSCTASTSTTINGYPVVIECASGSNDISLPGADPKLYSARITVTACSSGSCPDTTNPNRLGYVERRVEVVSSR